MGDRVADTVVLGLGMTYCLAFGHVWTHTASVGASHWRWLLSHALSWARRKKAQQDWPLAEVSRPRCFVSSVNSSISLVLFSFQRAESHCLSWARRKMAQRDWPQRSQLKLFGDPHPPGHVDHAMGRGQDFKLSWVVSYAGSRLIQWRVDWWIGG